MAPPTLEVVLRHLRALSDGQANRDLTDGDLLARFLARREEAVFALLVQRHGPMVLSLCRRLLGDAHDAEDAFQATFLILARKAGAVRKQGSLACWLYGVARRVAVRARAQAARRRERETRAGAMPRPEPFDTAGWDELRQVLDEEIGGLPEKYRAPLVLCHLEGKSQAQAADELGLAKSTVGGRLEKARALLRGRLARRGLALSAGAAAALLTEQAAPAQVPALLTLAAVRGAAWMVGGAVPAGVVPARALSLAEGVMRAMTMTKFKLFGLTLAAAGALTAGAAGLGWQAHGQDAAGQVTQASRTGKASAPADAEQRRQIEAMAKKLSEQLQGELPVEQEAALLAELQKLLAERSRKVTAERQQAALDTIAKGIDELRAAAGSDPPRSDAVATFDRSFKNLQAQLKAAEQYRATFRDEPAHRGQAPRTAPAQKTYPTAPARTPPKAPPARVPDEGGLNPFAPPSTSRPGGVADSSCLACHGARGWASSGGQPAGACPAAPDRAIGRVASVEAGGKLIFTITGSVAEVKVPLQVVRLQPEAKYLGQLKIVQINTRQQGESEGIGILVRPPGSPTSSAAVRPGDLILTLRHAVGVDPVAPNDPSLKR